MPRTPVDKAELVQLGLLPAGKLVLALTTADTLGQHYLVLSQKHSQSEIDPDPGHDVKIDLLASYYSFGDGRWKRDWTIEDGVDCPIVDSNASFYPTAVTVTDLDQNGIAEITVAYKLFCGGGVDPSVLKVILRQGKQKLAIRGQTLIKTRGQPSLGGEMTPDKALSLPANAVFKQHLEAIRNRVYIEKY
ncbi:hypothetical protein HSX11_09015 [Oxalobacteraceae bacterium]|nr:hypothetical protein [Oxalobacteraceae bacterium]